MFDEETERLLKERGLKCICQLCDCGRPHRHKGCRKTQPSVSLALQNGQQKMVSDYQSKFGHYHSIIPVEPIRPLQKPRDPNPPPMDMRTEKQMAYKVFENVDRMKPCKLKGEIEKLSDGLFNGQSVYKDSYPVHKVNQVKPIPQNTTFKPNTDESRNFNSETEYHQNFPKKEKIAQNAFREKPALSYNLLYPNEGLSAIPKQSYKNTVHDGQKGERVAKCVPHKDNVQLGTDGEISDSMTTNKTHFQQPRKQTPTKSMKPKQHLTKNGKFSGTTQNRSDYKYDLNEAKSARQQTFPEHPSLINLSMNVPVDFQTVKMMSYNSLPKVTEKVQTIKKLDRYTPPKEKFDTKTTNQDVFQNFGVQPRVGGIRQMQIKKSSAKIEGKSSYSSTFKNPGKVDRILYDAQYDDNLRLPPKSERFSDTSVMRSSYQSKIGHEKVKPFKPEYKIHTNNNDESAFSGMTHYQEIYKSNPFDACVFPKYLAKEQAAKRFGTTIRS